MSKPRFAADSQVVFVTRRTVHRTFRLRPHPLTNQIGQYLLAVLLPTYGLECFAYVFMSDHVHLGLIDHLNRLPDFQRAFFSLMARALNCIHETSDTVWDGSGPNVVILADADVVIDRTAYMLANPVKAALVEHGRDWPGLRSQPKDYGKTIAVTRPPAFFDEKSRVFPCSAELRLAIPPMAEHLGRGGFIHQVEVAVHAAEEAARDAHRSAKRPYVGAIACRQVSPFFSLGPRRGQQRRPRVAEVAARDEVSRAVITAKIKHFRAQYREARAEFLAGNRSVRWPAGTWYKVKVERCPSASGDFPWTHPPNA
jgi:putative transposase